MIFICNCFVFEVVLSLNALGVEVIMDSSNAFGRILSIHMFLNSLRSFLVNSLNDL